MATLIVGGRPATGSGEPLIPPGHESKKGIDYVLDHLVLDPEAKSVSKVNIAEAVTESNLTLTMEGASTLVLTMIDEDRHILRGDFLTRWSWGKDADHRDERSWVRDGRNIDLTLGDLRFRLVKISKQAGHAVELTFEDREVAKLRARHGAKKSTRTPKFTRAMFIAHLCREAGVPWHIPELHQEQPIEKAKEKLGVKLSRSEGARKGLDTSGTLRGKNGIALNPTELHNAEIALDVADSLHAPDKATAALLEACMIEGNPGSTGGFDNLSGGDGTSVGILQLIDSHHVDRRNVALVCHMFLTEGFTGRGGAIHLAGTGMSSAEIAQACQGSAFPSRYAEVQPQALALMRAYNGGALGTTSGTVTSEKPYEFTRGKHETSWDAIQRLAEEVGWYAFVRKGVLWYVSGNRLRKSAVDMQIRESDDAINEVTFDIDMFARDEVAEMNVEAWTHLWTALPGMVCKAHGQGPGDGRWLMHSAERSLADEVAQITLTKPVPKKKEPAPETESKGFHTEGEAGRGIQGAPDAVAKMWAKAREIDSHHYSYLFGGGHNSSFSPPYDCSGAVSAVLHAAGLLGSPLVSGDLANWGDSGAGKYITIFANGGHCFMSFKLPGGTHEIFWGTSGENPGGGAGFHSPRSSSGFAVRHPRGL
jgi:hypothetical protein